MLYSEIIADYCKDHKKHQATLSKIHTGLVHNTWYIQEALLRIQYNHTACPNCPVRVASLTKSCKDGKVVPVFNYAPYYEGIWEYGGIAPLFLAPEVTYNRVKNPPYPFQRQG
jgi:hypothetical protein